MKCEIIRRFKRTEIVLFKNNYDTRIKEKIYFVYKDYLHNIYFVVFNCLLHMWNNKQLSNGGGITFLRKDQLVWNRLNNHFSTKGIQV